MTYLLELVVNGTLVGALYALLAVGFVMVFRATQIVNFAQGSFLLIGGLTIAELVPHVGFWLALLAGVGSTVAAALVLHLLLSFRADSAGHLQLAIITIGFDVVLTTEMTRRLATEVRSLDDPFGTSALRFLGIAVPHTRAVALVVAVVVLLALTVAFRRTTWGTAMRAAAEDREAAMLVGIRHGRVASSAWAIAAVLAVIAVVFLTAYPTPGLEAGTAAVAFKVLPAIVLGGLDSPAGAVVGGLVVGITEQLALGYASELSFLGHGFAEVAPYVVAIAVLVVRPHGIFGTKEVARV